MTRQEWQKEFVDLPKVADNARPFKIRAKPDNDTLAILIHGFTSSPYHLRYLADYLAEKEIDVQTVLLAGHGGSQEDLIKTNHHDWLSSVRQAIVDNLDKYKNVYLIGHSLGANLSICLAVDYSRVKGIVALGPSIFIQGERWQRFFMFWYKLFGIKKWKKKWLKPRDIEELKKTGGRVHIPIKSIDQFYKFIDYHTKLELKHCHAPILIAHSRYDRVSLPKSSQYLFANIASKDKELFVLDKNSHGLLHKTRRDFLFRKIVDFIYEHN